jgi:F420-dependent oxidoreductase-like protein
MSRYGLQIPNFTLGVPDERLFPTVAGLARAAEETGYDSVWVMDHFYQLPALGGPDQPMLEAYTLLGAIGASTSRVRVGALVGGVTYRNPSLLAKSITTLDVITGGRAILGLGAAWYDVEHDGLGFEFPPVGGRMDRLEEALQICRAMLQQDHASFEGKHYRINDARNLPRPVQPGGPPIMVGGGGEKRTLRLVAKYADMCNVFGDPDMIKHKAAVLREHCEAVGRDPTEITFTRLGSMYLTSSDQEAESIRSTITKAAGEQVARAALIGNEEALAERIGALADAGVQYFIFNMPFGDAGMVRRAGTFLSALLS